MNTLKQTKMKTTKTMWAISIALLAATSCSETETEIDPEPGSGGQVSLGITPNLKVEAGTKAATKSVVDGDLITYTDYATAPGLGVLVTNSGATGWYTPDGTDDRHHVWYMGDAKGENWLSITDRGNSYEAIKEVPYYLTETVGKVYAYYPYDESINISSISSEGDLKIPVTVQASGSIAASVNNAEKIWNTSWKTNTANKSKKQVTADEKDYLYFAGPNRYVNNGRASGQPSFNPEDGPANDNADNPGYLISLEMQHGLAMVSFRVYDGGHLSDENVTFTKFQLKNHSDGELLKTGNGKMSLVDGAITENATAGNVTREITDYTLMKQVGQGEKESASAFIATPTVKGQSVSKSVSALVYPLNFEEDQIDAVITLKIGNGDPVDYTVTLPGYEWTAGTNCIYTFSAGRNKLTLTDVSVVEWEDDPQDDIQL